jgi:hypothetical protein
MGNARGSAQLVVEQLALDRHFSKMDDCDEPDYTQCVKSMRVRRDREPGDATHEKARLLRVLCRALRDTRVSRKAHDRHR